METSANGTKENNSAESNETPSQDVCQTRTMITASTTRSWREGDPFIRIVEQPHPTLYRFRYKSEGRLAGSMPGINSTDSNKTVPTIEIVNYTGCIDVLVSCVTVDEPYLQHPHNLVSKKNCKYGVYCIQLRGPPMQAVLNNVGIRCVRKDGIEKSLNDRKKVNFDPFGGGFKCKDHPVNLSAVRLCFQGFIPTGPKSYHKLPPVLTEPITDRKHVYELVINRLCSCSDKSSGGTEILMFCNPLSNANVQIRFYEEKNSQTVWEAFAKFEKTDVHLKCGIAFRTPPYREADVVEPVEVLIQLVRFSTTTATSDQRPLISEYSQPRKFTYYPDPDRHRRVRLEKRVQKMHNWVGAVNNMENVAISQTTEAQASLDRTLMPSSGQSQIQVVNEMDCCDYNDSMLGNQAANSMPPTNQFNSTVEPLLNTESQMDYQLQQLLQIWQSQGTEQQHHQQRQPQQNDLQCDPHNQEPQLLPMPLPHQSQIQPMQQQQQIFLRQNQAEDPYILQQEYQRLQQFGHIKQTHEVMPQQQLQLEDELAFLLQQNEPQSQAHHHTQIRRHTEQPSQMNQSNDYN